MSPEPLSQKAWRARNRDRINERQRKYRKTNQRTYSEKGYEQGALKRRGLTMADYMTMAIKQNNLCAICKQSEVVLNKDGLPKRLAVDHDHDTNKVRELLCQRCNLGIGWLDSIELLTEAVKYLTRHKVAP